MVYNDLKKGEKFLGILFFSLRLGFLSQDSQREFVARMHVLISSSHCLYGGLELVRSSKP